MQFCKRNFKKKILTSNKDTTMIMTYLLIKIYTLTVAPKIEVIVSWLVASGQSTTISTSSVNNKHHWFSKSVEIAD